MGLDEFQVGHTVNERYEVIGYVGQGGMGSVVKARRLKDGKTVAIKYCHLSEQSARQRFAREVRIMKDIEHPHVVPILGMSLRHDPPYFVMPFAMKTCSTRIPDYVADDTEAVSAFLELCEGLQAIHNAGAVHRDVKPDNALILDGRVVVSDLGLAKLLDRDSTPLTTTRAIVGTEGYIAPEQMMPGGSRDADVRTDIYQLGKTLYQMLTGLSPALLEPSKVPSGLIHVIRRATRENPRDRYQTVGELIDAVKTYQKAREPGSDPIGTFEGALERADELLQRGEYREEEMHQLMAVLVRADVRRDAAVLLGLFDRLPGPLLEIMAGNYSDEFGEVLRGYVEAIDNEVGGQSFSYAESVARRMRAIFQAEGTPPELKAFAIEASLMAAVRLNRFAAMGTLNSMLSTVSDDDDAVAIREVLERHRGEYGRVCDQVPALKLHPTIRELRNALVVTQAR